MGLICKKVVSYVIEEILDPVDKFIDEQQQKCRQYPWYDPRGWFCWIETITVKIIVYVTREVVVPISKTICYLMSDLAFLALAPFAAAIDSVVQKAHLHATLKAWLWTESKITFVQKDKDPSGAGDSYYYTFNCHCRNNTSHKITVTASNDHVAAQKAETECAKACS